MYRQNMHDRLYHYIIKGIVLFSEIILYDNQCCGSGSDTFDRILIHDSELILGSDSCSSSKMGNSFKYSEDRSIYKEKK
jgi:hypothetical protein